MKKFTLILLVIIIGLPTIPFLSPVLSLNGQVIKPIYTESELIIKEIDENKSENDDRRIYVGESGETESIIDNSNKINEETSTTPNLKPKTPRVSSASPAPTSSTPETATPEPFEETHITPQEKKLDQPQQRIRPERPRVPRNPLPRNPIPRKPLPRNKIPQNRLPRNRVPTGQNNPANQQS